MSNLDTKGKNVDPESSTPKNNTSSEITKHVDEKGQIPPIIEKTKQEVGPPSPIIDKTIGSVASLARLLPSNTVFAFQTLSPSFTNSGRCSTANKYLTCTLIIFSAILCFLFSFTDTFKRPKTGKFYFGIATFSGFYIMNMTPKERDGMGLEEMLELDDLRMRGIDWVHAIVSFAVFMAFAISDANVVMCLFPEPGVNLRELFINFPLALASLSSLIFFIFPSSRRGIGYAESSTGKTIGEKMDKSCTTATDTQKGK